MQQRNKILISVAAIAAVILVMLGVYTAFGPKTQDGYKAFKLTVVAPDGSDVYYTGSTDAETLLDIMDMISEGSFSYDGYDSDYGFYITTINGVTADYDTDQAYWAIYVNGEYGQYSADTQPVADGDKFELVYETYAAE